jgi:uncharacterized protein (DUF1697 family)
MVPGVVNVGAAKGQAPVKPAVRGGIAQADWHEPPMRKPPMPRHIAFLRGVSPQNLRMQDLRISLERAGFGRVRTVLSSGNAAFDAHADAGPELERAVAAAIAAQVGRVFPAIVRSADHLAALLHTDPFAGLGLPPGSKRVISFLRDTRPSKRSLPLTEGTATVIRQIDREAFTAYLPSPQGPVFMKLIEQAYGKEVTTRTWETVARCAQA